MRAPHPHPHPHPIIRRLRGGEMADLKGNWHHSVTASVRKRKKITQRDQRVVPLFVYKRRKAWTLRMYSTWHVLKNATARNFSTEQFSIGAQMPFACDEWLFFIFLSVHRRTNILSPSMVYYRFSVTEDNVYAWSTQGYKVIIERRIDTSLYDHIWIWVLCIINYLIFAY